MNVRHQEGPVQKVVKIAALAIGCLAATPAFAHVGLGDHGGFAHGFMHPLGGADHVLAMLGVGILAAQLGGRAMWAPPASFIVMMIAGGLLGFSGAGVPYVETGIAASVLVVGALIALNVEIPVAVAMALAGGFAVFHGFAHGAELPADSGPLAFGVGFVLATALLHGAGVGIGSLVGRLAGGAQLWAPRIVGGAMALAGVSLLA